MPPFSRRLNTLQWLFLVPFLWINFCVANTPTPISSPEIVTIGVLAYNGKARTLARWQATAAYLKHHIPDYDFQIKAVNIEELAHALRKGQLDFVLSNPGNYVYLEIEFGASSILTFKALHHDQVLTRFSSVFFTAKASSIQSMGDMRGRIFAAVDEEAFCGFQLAQNAMLNHGIDAQQEVNILWLGYPHQDIVQSVLSGKADAGTVRTGVLEFMHERGEIDLADIRILEAQDDAHFPFLHSTALYPEWPLSRLPDTDENLAKQVALALLQMSDDDWAAVSASGAGWTIPLDYRAVHALFRQLEIAPYAPPSFTLKIVWKNYWQWIILSLILLSLALLMSGLNWRRNQHLNITCQALEQTLAQRTLELNKINATLQVDIQTRIASEQILHEGCETLQALYTIAMRYDLSHEQRLQSLIDLGRQHLGLEVALLSYFDDTHFWYCLNSPVTEQTSPDITAPLSPEFAQNTLKNKQIHVLSNQTDWQQYIACPVYVAGKLRCLFEFATPQVDQSESTDTVSELSLRILNLMAHWVGSELDLMEHEKQYKQKHDILQQRFANVSAREKEVLRWVSDGESNKSIARLLEISPKTVELHRSNLLRKTGGRSSTELIKLAVLAGFLS